MSDVRFYLVSYDIANRGRWQRVFKLMRQMGEHLQFSVFLCRLDPTRMLQLEAQLVGLIDPAEDRLLVVEISRTEAAHRLRGTGVREALAPPRPVVV
jgi:CRISPR-associated protein Cas2